MRISRAIWKLNAILVLVVSVIGILILVDGKTSREFVDAGTQTSVPPQFGVHKPEEANMTVEGPGPSNADRSLQASSMARTEEPHPGYQYALKHWGPEVADLHKLKEEKGTLKLVIGCLLFQRAVESTRAIASGDWGWAEKVPSCMLVPNIFKPHIVTTLKDRGMTYYHVRLFIGEQSQLFWFNQVGYSDFVQ